MHVLDIDSLSRLQAGTFRDLIDIALLLSAVNGNVQSVYIFIEKIAVAPNHQITYYR